MQLVSVDWSAGSRLCDAAERGEAHVNVLRQGQTLRREGDYRCRFHSGWTVIERKARELIVRNVPRIGLLAGCDYYSRSESNGGKVHISSSKSMFGT